jgi:hypothetical protein
MREVISLVPLVHYVPKTAETLSHKALKGR